MGDSLPPIIGPMMPPAATEDTPVSATPAAPITAPASPKTLTIGPQLPPTIIGPALPPAPQKKVAAEEILKLPPPNECLFRPDNVKLGWFRKQGLGAGLRNMGNTCYLNSVLQCLAYAPPFANYCVSSDRHSNSCRAAGYCVLCSLEKLLLKMIDSRDKVLEPEIAAFVQKLSPTFRYMEQQDAHELLLQLCDAAHKCILKMHPDVPPSLKNTTFVQQIFGGHLRWVFF